MRALSFWLILFALTGTACGGSTGSDAGPGSAADADQDACADFCGGS
ncbi:MAG: hypothetical protein J0L92_21005 [Deltaproteobacteria bacterium]|nr:hypothetical protein [Deltaproteobacteria bacterium]